jgi:FkbM family methyltransferase
MARMVSAIGEAMRRHPLLLGFLKPLSASRAAVRNWRNAAHTAMLDRLASDLREDVCLRVRELDSDFWMDPRSHLFRRVAGHGIYEPEMAALIRRYVHPDRDVVDVGANIGFVTIAAAKRLSSGRVLAAEPTPAAFGRLVRNVERNGVTDRVLLAQCLLGDRQTEMTLHVIPGQEEYSSLQPLVHPNANAEASVEQTLPMQRLDDLVARHGLDPAFLKIDVEGAEALVLAGARTMLERSRPVIVAEFSLPLLARFGAEPRAILQSLEALGYEVSDPGAVDGVAGRRTMGELLAIPR